MSRQDCDRETLAQSCVGFVELCSCGSVHLGIGPMTLRIEPATFERFADVIVEARQRLRSRSMTPAMAAQFARVPHEAT